MEESVHQSNHPEHSAMEDTKPKLMHLPIGTIEPDAQIRLDFDEEAIANLSKSLKSEGQLIAILAYHDSTRDVYIILDGERRWRAAREAGLVELKAEVWPYRPSPEEILMMQLSIDQQREQLNPVEQAAAYRKVMQANGWNASELAAHIHVSHTTITRATSLLELPHDLQALVKTRELPVNIARELARITDPSIRDTVWTKVKNEGLNAVQCQQLVSKVLKPTTPKRGPKPKQKFTYRNLGGFDASITARKITLTATKKGRSPQEVEKALELLLQRYREDRAKSEPPIISNREEAAVPEHAITL